MKKALRIIIPIVLALAILLCTAWYLFIYDREFTRDMFLHTARFFERQGNRQLSAWCYDVAYRQSADNDAVAIELAQQHAAAGNYLQSEVTLSNALMDGASVDLYVALCQIYLEQDKILDAVKLLDAVCGDKSTVDPAVKQELRAMRPEAPTADLESGFYNPEQHSTVMITAKSGVLYLNREGTYPSVDDALYNHLIDAVGYIGKNGKTPISANGEYTETVLLADGENVIYTLAISDEGLVSPLSVYTYTVGTVKTGVVEEAVFVDSVMEAQIRKALGASSDEVIMTDKIWELTEFTVPAGAQSLEDMRHLLGVEKLTVEAAPEGQLSHLGTYANLTELKIYDTAVTAEELALIGNLPKLENLTLEKCKLSSLNGLENAQKLTYLDLTNNSLLNITPLRGLTNLKELCIKENSLADISAISGLTNLQKLDLSRNVIGSLGGIEGCTALTELDVSSNRITDLSPVTKLPGLLRLNFAYNKVSALPTWEKTVSLVTIDGSNNTITSLEPLRGLENLNNVYMDYNEGLSSVDCLADCHVLIQVNVYGTKVTNVSKLTDMSVIVKYDPT